MCGAPSSTLSKLHKYVGSGTRALRVRFPCTVQKSWHKCQIAHAPWEATMWCLLLPRALALKSSTTLQSALTIVTPIHTHTHTSIHTHAQQLHSHLSRPEWSQHPEAVGQFAQCHHRHEASSGTSAMAMVGSGGGGGCGGGVVGWGRLSLRR